MLLFIWHALHYHLFLSDIRLLHLCLLRVSIFFFKYLNLSLLFLLIDGPLDALDVVSDLSLHYRFDLLLCEVHVRVLCKLGNTYRPFTPSQGLVSRLDPLKVVLSQSLPVQNINFSLSYYMYLALAALDVS